MGIVRAVAALVTLCAAESALTGTPHIVVYGSTPGGVVAAVAAARSPGSAAVTLVDPYARVGGMCSSGLGATDEGDPAAIGGYSKEFFLRVARVYNCSATEPQFHFEPHVAEAVFLDMLSSAGVKRVRTGPVANVSFGAALRVSTLTTVDGQVFIGDVFIDGSYTGDLAAAAGVTTTWGREARSAYNESWAGRREPFGVNFDSKQFTPLDAAGNLLPLMTTRLSAPLGSGDDRVQGYNYRLCVTQNRSNLLPFPPPANYNASTWEALRREAQANITSPDFTAFVSAVPVPNGKYDLNNGDFVSTDATGLSWPYPNASYEDRAAIDTAHREYMLEFFYFLQVRGRGWVVCM